MATMFPNWLTVIDLGEMRLSSEFQLCSSSNSLDGYHGHKMAACNRMSVNSISSKLQPSSSSIVEI